MLSADWSLTDRSTWLMLLTASAAVLSDIFHRSFASYVPAAATLAAGVTVAGIALAKHHYAAVLTSMAATIPAAKAQAPALPAEVTTALSTAAQALTDVSNLVSSPRAPQPAAAWPVQPLSAPVSPAPPVTPAPTAAAAPAG